MSAEQVERLKEEWKTAKEQQSLQQQLQQATEDAARSGDIEAVDESPAAAAAAAGDAEETGDGGTVGTGKAVTTDASGAVEDTPQVKLQLLSESVD